MLNFFRWFFGLGAIAVVPLYIVIIGYAIHLSSSKVFKAALSAAVGFSGLYALVGLMSGSISPASQAMSKLIGSRLSLLDVGWPVIIGGVMYSLKITLPVIIGMVIFNIILVAIGWVENFDTDIFNMALMIFAMMSVYLTTNSWIWATIALAVEFFIVLKLGDWLHPFVEQFYGMHGVTITHPNSTCWAPIGFFMDWVWDRIPKIRDIDIDPESLTRKFGVFGQPMMIGAIVGLIFGGIAFFRWPVTYSQITHVYTLLLATAFFMTILPKVVGLIIEGISPLGEGVKNLVHRGKIKRELTLGVDVAVCVGAPEQIALGLMVIPFIYLWAALLPNQKILPLVDAGVLFIFTTTFLLNTNKQNLFRGLLNSILIEVPLTFFMANKMTPVVQKLITYSGFKLTQGTATGVSCLISGMGVFNWPFTAIFSFISGKGGATIGDFIIALLIIAIFAALWYIFRKRPVEYAKQLREKRG